MTVNYIKEISEFYKYVRQVPLSGSAITLWHALMQVNNDARWRDSFTAPAISLKPIHGLTDSTFKRARKELADKGYITWQSRPNNQAPIYSIRRLGNGDFLEASWAYGVEKNGGADSGKPTKDELGSEIKEAAEAAELVGELERVGERLDERMNGKDGEVESDELLVSQSTDQPVNHLMNHPTDHPADHVPDHLTDPLYKHKQNNNKLNKTKTSSSSDAVIFFKNNFDEKNSYVEKSLVKWIHEIGELLVMEAMKRALERNKSWYYVNGILQKWSRKGITTMEQLQREDEIYFKGRKTYPTRSHSNEIVPDWFEEHKRVRRERAKNNQTHVDPVKAAEVEAWLATHKQGV